ncbi:hypothetical protein Tco_1321334 [Tanacetum coccineum]
MSRLIPGRVDPDESPMPELEIFHMSETGVFDEASYDEEAQESQILSDPKSAVQTRSKVQQKSGSHALFSYIQKQQRNNHKDQQHFVFACFLSQKEPKKISEALQDDSWVSIQAKRVKIKEMKEEWLSEIRQDWLPEGTRRKKDKYVAEILKKFDLVNVKTAITPIETKVALTKDEEVVDVDVNPKTSHLNAVKRIFKYLKGKPHLGLWYPKESPFDLEAFSDSDYGRSNLDRKSTTVLLRKFDGEQLIVGSKSTTGLWFQFHEYQIHIDNESTICIVKNPSVSFQDKAHREYAPQFMKNRYEKKLIRVLEGHQDLLLPAAACCLLLIQVHVRTLEGLQSQPSSSTIPVPSTSLPPEQSPPPTPTPIPASTPTPIPEIDPEPLEHTFKNPSPTHQHFSPPQEHAQGQMTVDDLLQLVPQLMTRVDSLEKDLKQTKLTMGSAIVKLVKKVKKLEGILKRRNVVLSDSEEEEPEAQGRKSQDDPLVSLVQGLVTPSKTTVNASGEEQPKSIDKGRRYKRRKETKGKKVVTSLDFQEEVSTGYAEGVNTGSIKVSTVSGKVSTVSGQVSTDSIKKSIPSPDKGQREGKAPMIIEEAPKKTKEQILQEEASLAEAIRLDTLEKEEEAKQVHLDSLLA